MYHIKRVIALECFHIVTHSYAASLSIKTCLHKTNIVFTLDFLTKVIYLNPFIVYKSKLKMKVTSP